MAQRFERFIRFHQSALLAELYSASIAGRVAKVGDAVDLEDLAASAGPRCATISGFGVRADVCVPSHDRMRLERLAGYAGRSPPVATGCLSVLPAGRLLHRLMRRRRDGTSYVIFAPLERVLSI